MVKHIYVTCGIVELNNCVLSVQRSDAMSLPLKWEFPGGKIEQGESPEECLKRELFEELGINVRISYALASSTYSYPTFIITLYPFICKILSGEIILKEHADIVWLHPSKLFALDWAAADIPVVQVYLDSKGIR